MRRLVLLGLLGSVALVSGSASTLAAAQTTDELTAVILRRDALFWTAYNTCATARIGEFFTADVEFYHDTGGMTFGVEALETSSPSSSSLRTAGS